jgi:hypothetical protein
MASSRAHQAAHPTDDTTTGLQITQMQICCAALVGIWLVGSAAGLD